MKSPPVQYRDDDARHMVEAFIAESAPRARDRSPELLPREAGPGRRLNVPLNATAGPTVSREEGWRTGTALLQL